MRKHLMILYITITLLCLGGACLSTVVYAAEEVTTAGSTDDDVCCGLGYNIAYRGSNNSKVCCKEGTSQGDERSVCCSKAGGKWIPASGSDKSKGKCCRCKPDDKSCASPEETTAR